MSSHQPGTPCWAELATPDVEVAKAFYAGLFGWDARTPPDPATGGYTMFTLGGAEGHEVAAVTPLLAEGRQPVWTGYVSVADTAGACKAVLEQGGHVHLDPQPVPGRGTAAVCADPMGAVFGLWQPEGFAGAAFAGDRDTFCWSELACRDIDAARSFYSAVFGWSAETAPFAGGTSTYTTFSLDGRRVAGMVQMNEAWPAEIPPHWMVYFAADDTDAACERVTRLGGTVSVPPSDTPFGRLAVVGDPHGAYFSLIRPADPLPGA
ncbi:VOC family protein [Actinocorallia longicatena]